jgi:hypothetical protein
LLGLSNLAGAEEMYVVRDGKLIKQAVGVSPLMVLR